MFDRHFAVASGRRALNAREISDHMLVVGCDGETVGVVDGVEGDRIRLADTSAGAIVTRNIRVDWVETVESGLVNLSVTAMQARAEWQSVSTPLEECARSNAARRRQSRGNP